MKNKEDLIQDDGQESQTNGDQAIKETKAPQEEEEIETNNNGNRPDSPDKVVDTEPVTDPDDTSTEGTEHPEGETKDVEGGAQGDQESTNEGDEAPVSDEISDQDSSDSAEEPGSDKPADSEEELDLPEGVTLEPQCDDHMDLNLIKSSPSLVQAYLRVLDNTGGLTGDENLEQAARQLCNRYSGIDWDELDDPERHLEELKALSADYSIKLNIAENVIGGVGARSRIQQGMLFGFQKRLVRKMGQNWTFWFNNNHNTRSLRSVQNYMDVASIPNVIRYAVFGIKRLQEIKRAIKITVKDNDPIGTFLKEQNLTFDPNCEDSIDDFKKEIDVAITKAMIKKEEEDKGITYGVNENLVRDIVLAGNAVDSGVIDKIHIIHASDGDVNAYLKNRVLKGNKEDPRVTVERKITGFPKLVSGLKDVVDLLKENVDRVSDIDETLIDTLEAQIVELKALVNRS